MNAKEELNLLILKKALKRHRKELKLLQKMSDEQFEAFKENLELSKKARNRIEAIGFVKLTIALNLKLQNQLKSGKSK